MRTAEFRKTAWHYKLASFGGLYGDKTDICEYLRAIMKGIVGGLAAVALILFIGGLIAWGLGDFLGWVACLIFHGYVAPDDPALIAAVLLFSGAVLLLCWGAGKAIKATAREVEDTFIGDAYDSLKHRMCFRVRIK